jgi:hypothetical protein
MKKLYVFLIAIGATLAITAASASADVIKFQLVDLYGWGTSYSYTGFPNPTPYTYTPVPGPAGSGNGTVSNPYYDLVDDGTANGSTAPQGFNDGIYKAPDGKEDGFNVSVIQFIKNETSGVTYYDASLASYELTAFIWGYDDVMLKGGNILTGDPTAIYSQNLKFEIWKEDKAGGTAYDPTLGTAGRSLDGIVDAGNPAGTLDPTHYDTVTDGSLYLSGTGHNVLGFDDNLSLFDYSFYNNYNFATNSGTGGGLLDFTGGSQLAFYDTDQYSDNRHLYTGDPNDEGFADAQFSFSSFANYPSPEGPGTADWLIFDDSSVVTQPIPEPASMLLLGTGLVGLAGISRKRRKKNLVY